MLKNFYANKLEENVIKKEMSAIAEFISFIFITWNDYQQFMDDFPNDFCWALQAFMNNYPEKFSKQHNNLINGMLAPMIAHETEWITLLDGSQEHEIKGLD